MAYTTPHTWVAGDFLRASWLNIYTTDLEDHETRIDALETAPAPVSALGDLTDVTLGSPVADGDSLVYDAGTDTWVNGPPTASLSWQGAWNIATAYTTDDVVEHDGSSWIATEATTGDEPGVGSPNPWDLLAAKGDTGSQGIQGVQGDPGPQGDSGLVGDWLGAWDSGTAYVTNDIVEHNGSSWIATSGSTNNEPGVGSPDPWDLVAAKGDTGAAGGGGAVVQVVNVLNGTRATGTTVIPLDTSIPQNTEGDEYMTLAITPTSATNKLVIDVLGHFTVNTNTRFVSMALFQDSTADALNATSEFFSTSGGTMTLPLRHYMTAGTTSATTFKVRAGPHSAATVFFNGDATIQFFGGVYYSSITITELVP